MTRIRAAFRQFLSTSFVAVVAFGLTTGASFGQEKEQEKEKGYEVLFDGSSMKNFRGYKSEKIGAGWSIKDKALFFNGKGGGDIVTKKAYANFDMKFEWKISPGGNSGVMFRVGLGDYAPYQTGPEYQILDDSKHNDGKNKLTSSAALYGLFIAKDKKLNEVGKWNTGRIVVNGNQIQHYLNGKKVVDTTMGSEQWKEALAKSKFRTWKKFATKKKGHLAFQDHGDKVWYRNVRIKTLK